MALKSLKLLEEKLNGVLERQEQIRHEKAALAKRLGEQERANGRLRQRLKQYEREREEIRTRLERILNHFDGLGIELRSGDDEG
jgi:septal ring factor EnvC (AmiA/AmiB activator)